MSNQPPTAVWRPTSRARNGAAVAAGFWTVIGCLLVGTGISRGSVAEGVIGTIVVLVAALIYVRMTGRPRIEIRDGYLVIVNPWRTVRVGLDAVLGATPGYRGITIVYEASGQTRSIDAWAVQKANVSTWRKVQTRADDVAGAIRAAAASARTTI